MDSKLNENKNICLISSKKIKYFAKDRRLKMKELAILLNIKERALFNKLNYTSTFSDTEVAVLTSVLRCTRDDLLKDYDELSEIEIEFCKKFNCFN